jgi:predicted AAA+ superfamily ATPase
MWCIVLLEEKQGWQFILTGSSARKLKRSGVNLLAGRAVVRHLHPFMAGELAEQFSLSVVFLASEGAQFINGAIIPIDGGSRLVST